ncbi:MAG TPA: heparinase II/III family protein [Xanthobacteraceae bacterium]|nr:heparinase II/III family protein [Xanthobacteraceae bacterium]
MTEGQNAAMSRVAVSSHAKLSWLLLRGVVRRMAGRANSHPIMRWPLAPLKTDRLLISPQDLRTADATRASEIYSGRFAFAGKVVVCDGRSIFEMEAPSEEWAAMLHGFGWLRHLRAAESGITRANARALIDEWITLRGSYHPAAWRPDVLSRRIISWLSQSTLVLQDADARFYRRFLRSLIRQIRYLRHTAGDARRGVARMQAAIALSYATLCIAGQARHIASTTARLSEEIERQILPDGGHVSRDPGAVIEILLEFLPLRQAFSSRNIAPPQAVLNAIDRMMPMLRFFRHSEGSYAHFNGMGATPADLLSTLLAYDEAHGAPLANAPYSAYQRLEAHGAVLLCDTGKAPPIEMSLDAHAGCLSFEFSSPKQSMLIVNCGMPAVGREDWRQLARSTAAHSTVVIEKTSSARFVELATFRRVLGGSPMLGGPHKVTVSREDQGDAVVLRMSHDAYADRFGIIHERVLTLASDGARLDGEDIFLAADGSPQLTSAQDEFAVRFHLHPAIKVTRLTDSHGAMLMTPNKEIWTFSAREDRIELEDSVYLAAPEGPRRTTQIVIHGNARTASRVQWCLQYAQPTTSAGAGTARRARDEEEEPQLPL